jgi:hypothetical protein
LDSSFILGPFSVAPCQTLVSRFATFSSLCRSGRTILVMRPGKENTKNHEGQIRYLVFCLEAALRTCVRDDAAGGAARGSTVEVSSFPG